MRIFGEQQWKAIKDSKKETQPDVPAIMEALPIMIDAFQDHWFRCIGQRDIPLAYVIRENVAVPDMCPDRMNHQPYYSEEHGSTIGDLIDRASHDHGLNPKDN